MGSSAGGKSKKAGRFKRKPCNHNMMQYKRTYNNKLNRVNRILRKLGKPQLVFLPGYDFAGIPEGKMVKEKSTMLAPPSSRKR